MSTVRCCVNPIMLLYTIDAILFMVPTFSQLNLLYKYSCNNGVCVLLPFYYNTLNCWNRYPMNATAIDRTVPICRAAESVSSLHTTAVQCRT